MDPQIERVDAVIPVFNGAALVAEAIESVLAQTVPPTALIVVDDASTDATPRILAGYGDRIRVVRHPVNRGLAAARNTGIAAGDAPLVGFLDHDDVWRPRMVERQAAEFAAHPGLGLSYTSLIDCDEALRPLGPPRRVRRRRAERLFEALYLEGFPLPPSTVFMRRTVFGRAGLFDETMRKKEDFEYWLRVAMVVPVSALDEPLALRRVHAASLTRATAPEENLRFDALCFRRCAEAAARLGVALPLPVEERIRLGQRRRYREFLRWGEPEAAAYYRRVLEEAGALTAGDRAAAAAIRLESALRAAARALLRRRP